MRSIRSAPVAASIGTAPHSLEIIKSKVEVAPLASASAPYGGRAGLSPWVRFEDDLIDLSVRYPGLVIVVDHADILLREKRHDMFELIEEFLHCFYHWYEKKKPCHLCLTE